MTWVTVLILLSPVLGDSISWSSQSGHPLTAHRGLRFVDHGDVFY